MSEKERPTLKAVALTCFVFLMLLAMVGTSVFIINLLNLAELWQKILAGFLLAVPLALVFSTITRRVVEKLAKKWKIRIRMSENTEDKD